MSLSRRQTERADLTVTIEQGRRVEGELFAENTRGIRTMGELFRARMFGATNYAISQRKRMMAYVEGGPTLAERHPDPHPEHGVLCDCYDCDEAVKRLLRDCGVLPRKGGPK